MTTTIQIDRMPEPGACVAGLRQLLDELLVAVHDCPAGDVVVLVGQIEDDLVDATSALEGVEAALASVPRLVAEERVAAAAAAAGDGQRRLAGLCTLFGERLASPQRLQHVADLARTRGPGWAGWSKVVHRLLSGWPGAMRAAQEMLAELWKFLVTRAAGMRSAPAPLAADARIATQRN